MYGAQHRLPVGHVVDQIVSFDVPCPSMELKQRARMLALYYMQPLLASILCSYLRTSPHDTNMHDDALKRTWANRIWERFFHQASVCVWQPQDSKLWKAVEEYTKSVSKRVPVGSSQVEFDRTDPWSIIERFSTSQSIFKSFDVRWKNECGARQRVSDVAHLNKNAMLREAIHEGFEGIRLEYDGLPSEDATEPEDDGSVDVAMHGLASYRPSSRWVCFGRVLLKAWLQSNTINRRISDIVLRAIQTDDVECPSRAAASWTQRH